MSYREFKDDHGFLRKEWRNELGQFHREDGPAEIICYNDGETLLEAFWLNGESLGYNKVGFWAFWNLLTEEQRQAPSILKYLARFS